MTLLGAEVTHLIALRVPACGLTCVVQGAASPQGCLPPGGRREEGDACPHLMKKGGGRRLSPPHELVCERQGQGPWSSPDEVGGCRHRSRLAGRGVSLTICVTCPAAFGEWEVCVQLFRTPGTVAGRVPCSWDSPTQGSNLCLLCWQVGSLPPSHLGSPCCWLEEAGGWAP